MDSRRLFREISEIENHGTTILILKKVNTSRLNDFRPRNTYIACKFVENFLRKGHPPHPQRRPSRDDFLLCLWSLSAPTFTWISIHSEFKRLKEGRGGGGKGGTENTFIFGIFLKIFGCKNNRILALFELFEHSNNRMFHPSNIFKCSNNNNFEGFEYSFEIVVRIPIYSAKWLGLCLPPLLDRNTGMSLSSEKERLIP